MLFPGMMPETEDSMRIAIASLCRSTQGKLLYALEAGDVAGIFSLNQVSSDEQRLFHNSDFGVGHLSFQPEHNLIACTIFHGDGTANIATMSAEGARPNEVTEGDSLDLAPAWIPGTGKALVFQSAGIGRDRQGIAREQAAFTIEKLDFDRREVTSLAADPNYDFLRPQIAADNTLYYIRRPYQPQQKRFNPLRILRDLLLMPFRLLYAIFQWLNFFTHRYTGKPLINRGKQASIDVRHMTIWGMSIDTEQAKKQNRSGDEEAPALVPRSWQLMRQQPNSQPEVVSEGVLSFDLADDGAIAYTNGSAIYALHPDGSTERLLIDRLIEQVIVSG